jgi:hypothetical protein
MYPPPSRAIKAIKKPVSITYFLVVEVGYLPLRNSKPLVT